MEWSASGPGRFTPRERALFTHWIGGWVGTRAVLDAVVKRKIPSPHRESKVHTVGKMCFVFDFILHIAYTVDACALTSILPSVSLIDMIYFTADTKATPASV
jgi:hypothetical protein